MHCTPQKGVFRGEFLCVGNVMRDLDPFFFTSSHGVGRLQILKIIFRWHTEVHCQGWPGCALAMLRADCRTNGLTDQKYPFLPFMLIWGSRTIGVETWIALELADAAASIAFPGRWSWGVLVWERNVAYWWNEIVVFTVGDFHLVCWKPTQLNDFEKFWWHPHPPQARIHQHNHVRSSLQFQTARSQVEQQQCTPNRLYLVSAWARVFPNYTLAPGKALLLGRALVYPNSVCPKWAMIILRTAVLVTAGSHWANPPTRKIQNLCRFR